MADGRRGNEMDPKVPPEVLDHYERAPEQERLTVGASQLEFARTKEVICRWLPSSPAVVLDVGGGPGRYAAWLAGFGHQVHLVDATPRLVEQARRSSYPDAGPIASCTVGDAQNLERDEKSADVVLLLGPLYHLTDRSDRLRALSEAHRVLVPGGLLFAGAISRFASALDGLARDLFVDTRFRGIVAEDLASGIHRNATDRLDYFTTAYFHRPEELEGEVAAAGFSVLEVVGLEGPGWIFPDFEDRWRDDRRRDDLRRIAGALEAEPSIRGLSAHLVAVARRPG